MAISKISANEFATRISESVNNRDSSIDTSIGPIRDVFIDPFSDVLENQNDRILYLNSLLSLRNASSLVPDDIDDVVSNENLVRWQGSRSIVTLTFSRTSDFTSDYIVPVNFPVSTITDPSTGNIVSFKTVETKTMTSATMSRYYNPDTKQYELNVLAASIPTGITTQIGANTIIKGKSTIKEGSSIGQFCLINNSLIEEEAILEGYNIIVDSHINEQEVISLRETVVEENVIDE
jgi:hypothetical protein